MRHRKFVLLLVFVPVGFAEGGGDAAVANHVSALMQQGSAHLQQNKYVEAEASYRASLTACESGDEAKPCEQLPLILENLGAVYCLTNQFSKAEPLLVQALDYLSGNMNRWEDSLFGSKAAVTADTLVELALVYRREGRLSEAEDLYRRAIATYRDEPAAKYLPVALHNLGQVLIEQQNTKEADRLLREAIAIWEKQLGPEHPDVAAGLTSLGILLTSKNKLSEAESVLRRASDIDQKSLLANNPKIGYDRENLAAVAAGRKHYAAAQVLLEEAKAILESCLPPNHPEIGRILARLGEAHLRQGDLEQSETLYQGALTILEHAWGQESPLLLPLLENYSVVLRSRKDYAAAASVDMRTMRIRVKQALGTPSRE